MSAAARCIVLALLFAGSNAVCADELPIVSVEGQPLAANAERLASALTFLGAPFPDTVAKPLSAAITARDAAQVQRILDRHVLYLVTLNPESRVKVARGPAEAVLQQSGFVPVMVKVVNESTVKKTLNVTSPQSGPVYGGAGRSSKDPNADLRATGRFLHVGMFTASPMTANLSGLEVEYAILLIYSSEAGKREATIGFDVGQGTQDLGFRGETSVLFHVKPAIPVRLRINDSDGRPTTARFTFRDSAGRIYPPQAKRLAPDLFFQQQVYRHDNGIVLLPPGALKVEYGRGPEYRLASKEIIVPAQGEQEFAFALERWINPADYGFFSGDHHIHSAGCAHYTSPTEGVSPDDMFLYVKGEALNVGCCLTWGPCYEFQRTFFESSPHKLSEPLTVIKYDVEVSGFGSESLGHVCLLNLRDQTYPGSEGTKTKGWPTWTTPLMRWAKTQGAVTGYAHSASGLNVNALQAAGRLLRKLDADKDGSLSLEETKNGLLPDQFTRIDADEDGKLSEDELVASHRRAAVQLPNLAVPEMNGIGAQEVFVTTAMKVCDFISAMDTQRVPEWNCWYHIMNCGFPLKVSGETDFPCISGSRVGQGRVYVQLGKIDRLDFGAWCDALAQGRSYISDGYAHALRFTVDDRSAGDELKLSQPGRATVKATVAFAATQPLGTAVGGRTPQGPSRNVELVVNGVAVESKSVPADDRPHELEFRIPIEKSSWVALRHFPSLHTNPVTVTVGDKPIRASRQSAQWCIAAIEQLWRVRGPGIAEHERAEAEATFQKAIEIYKKIAAEAEEGS
jgi:hypothetical protein